MKKGRTKGFVVFIVLFLLLGTAVFQFSGLKDFDLTQANITEVSFQSGNNTLAGSLIRPDHVTSPPIVLIIQGDGAKSRFADSRYLPLINHLLANGIGVFSWDKPGVGDSTGTWLQQSMQDRSDEVRAVYAKIQTLPALHKSPIGLLGFSQAGWVLPITDNEIHPAFTIIIGGAVSWRHQQAYSIQRQLETDGLSPTQINKEVMTRLKDNDNAFGDPETANPSFRPRMNPDRFDFIARNYGSDATPYLATMQGPVLALWGEEDSAADPIYNQNIYNQHLHPEQNQQTALIKNANHELLNVAWFDYQHTGDWPFWKKGIFFLLGHHAYAPRALNTLSTWIQQTTKK